ncbi:uncharacterized protein [Cherax quadricarinatus]|uniref:uncharacterized protein isoform X2 n=1 Tax=Cherax quadricarinatus TaxID=27406 RepID=UPI00387EAE40
MTSLKCLCNPLLCAKCPSEYKSLSHLRQHLGSKYKASRTQTFLVTQKHKELLTNCKKCNHRVAGKRWFSSICFPTEKVLQDHLTLAHRKVKISKCEESNSGSGVSDCACMKVFQCSFCSHSYSECSYLEKHWQATGHQPLHWQAALEDLQIKSKRTKVYCKKCSRENKAIMDNDTCPCRLTFLCSVCLTVFNSYTNLKNHWKMTNHHSDDDSENLSTEARGNDCLLCSPRRANSSLHLNEGSVFSSEDPTKTLSNNVTPWIEESVNGSIEKVELYSSLLKNITETKRSLKSNVQKRDLHHRESDLSSSKSALSSCTGSEDVLNSNSYEIIMNDIEEVDLETDDTLVTITISENKEDERNLHAECSAAVQITNNTFCEYPINLKDCFQQCLKFISAGCTCQRGNCVSSQENDFDLSKTADCSACCLEVNCFMCSNTFSSYYKLRDHLIKDHSLKINANMLSDPGSEYLHIIVKHLKVLNCNCAHYECKKCKETFQQRLVLLHHILSHHPQFYSTFSFFPFHSVACYTISCPQCAILEKLCTINYLLFIKVLLEIENCQKDKYTLLLDWCPSVKPVRHNVECLSEEPHKKAELLDSSRDGKVVCYCITQQTHSGKIVPRVKKMKHSVSECICPLLKCPTCPKTTATFGSLRKHIRLNNHNNWNMKLLWRKYKIIKENCSACGRFPYLDYILCPHCPHISFEDEEAAEAHMDSLHREKVNKCTGSSSPHEAARA